MGLVAAALSSILRANGRGISELGALEILFDLVFNLGGDTEGLNKGKLTEEGHQEKIAKVSSQKKCNKRKA